MSSSYAELAKRLRLAALAKNETPAPKIISPIEAHRQQLIGTLGKPTGRREWALYKQDQSKTDGRLDLTGSDFSGYDLRDYDLSGAILTQCIFLNCDLAGTNFTDSILSYADLRRVSLRSATLDRAQLGMAILNDAGLIDASLTDASMKGVHLAGANLTGADLTGADLTGGDLRGATLKFAKLTRANLRGANLADANLTGVVADEESLRQARNALKAVVDEHEYQPMAPRKFQRPGGAATTGIQRARRFEEDEDTEPRQIARQGAPQTQPNAPSPPRQPALKAEPDFQAGGDSFSLPRWEVEPDLESSLGCCQVLEVPPNAPLEVIVSAFRQKAKLYHPDMVRHLAPRIQELASLEFQRLHKAYERLTRRTTRSIEGVAWVEGVPHRASPYEYTIEEYDILVRANTNNSSLIYNLAWKYFEAGRHVEALAYFTRVLELDSTDEDARYNAMICRICLELINATQRKA